MQKLCVNEALRLGNSAVSSPPPGPVRAVAKFFFEGSDQFFVKGVTYGPFKPDAEGHYLGHPDQVDRDLAQMRDLGLNVLRIYHAPPLWFLDRCAAARMRVLITVPWAKHVEFLRKKSARDAIVDSVRTAVAEHAGHPAIFGYLVGNEISSTMVRWLGVRRVTEFIEHLIRVGRAANPNVLFSYASYPPTEFLLPQNADFCCFNVYLHHQREFERYLLRLQNLAEDRPLILGEFGMDTIRHTEEEQAEMLGWHVDSVVKCGLAGTVFFSWTDEWFTGEQEITDWAFGLVTRDRQPKRVVQTLRAKLGQDDAALPHRPLPQTPFVSVIVCSYNGAPTLVGLFGVVRPNRLSGLTKSFLSMTVQRMKPRRSRPVFPTSVTSGRLITVSATPVIPAPPPPMGRFSPTPIPTAWRTRIGSIT